MERQKEASDIVGGLKRLFKAGPFDDFSYEDIKRFPFDTLAPDQKALFDQVRLRHLRADPSRFADYKQHLQHLNVVNAADVTHAEKAIADEIEAAQQAAMKAHTDASNQRMRNIGQDALLASGGVGLGLYGGKKVYDSVKVAVIYKEREAENMLKESADPKLQALKDDAAKARAGVESFKEKAKGHAEKVKAREAKTDAAFKNMEQQEAAKSQSLDRITSGADNLTKQVADIHAPKPKPKLKAPMSRAGKAGLIGAGIAGAAGLGGYGLYRALKKESEEQPQLSEEQMQYLRLSALTPEQRALYMQVNPAGVPKMATNSTSNWRKEDNKGWNDKYVPGTNVERKDVKKFVPHVKGTAKDVKKVWHDATTLPKEAGFRDFVSRHLGNKSEEFLQGRRTLDVAAKQKSEQDLLNAYAKKRGLSMSPTGEVSPQPTPPPPKEPGFLQRNKWPLAIGAAGAGGLYMLNQQDKQGSYNETLSRLGLSKLAAKMPPPVPFKAKGKPFFTPSQSTAAKKMDGPAPAKAPWEEKTSSFDRGYTSIFHRLGLSKVAGKAEILARKARNFASKAERTSGTQTALAVQSANPAVNKMQSYLSGGAVGPKPSPKANMQSYVGTSLHQPSAATPSAKPSAAGVDKMRAYNKPAVAPQPPNAATKTPGILGRAKGQWDQMGNLGKGMLAGGAGLGLLGGGMGMGAAMSPDVVVQR